MFNFAENMGVAAGVAVLVTVGAATDAMAGMAGVPQPLPRCCCCCPEPLPWPPGFGAIQRPGFGVDESGTMIPSVSVSTGDATFLMSSGGVRVR